MRLSVNPSLKSSGRISDRECLSLARIGISISTRDYKLVSRCVPKYQCGLLLEALDPKLATAVTKISGTSNA
jgi:hypothetical protein